MYDFDERFTKTFMEDCKCGKQYAFLPKKTITQNIELTFSLNVK